MVRYLSQGLNTIEELQNSAYEGLQDVNKADAPLLSNTTGSFNTVFGAEAWMQLNQKTNLFSVLPKKPFQQSGFRIETAYPGTLGTGGTAETAGLPDTIKPTFEEAALVPSVQTAIESYITALGIGDDVIVSEIVERAMGVSGMYNVVVQEPTSDLSVSSNELPVPTSASGTSLVVVS